MSQPVSLYILTCNSAWYLPLILERSQTLADEILILDSGSTDNTLSVAESFGCRILFRPFDNFRNQRAYAIAQCSHPWVLSFDSDEVPSEELAQAINRLKQTAFQHDAYTIRRDWWVLGKKVHVMYPVVSPDYPIRLFNRQQVGYDERSTAVHETPHGYTSLGQIEAPLHHYTFHTAEELKTKLDLYTTIAARDLHEQQKPITWFKLFASPVAAWFKWYVIKGGWKDGRTGFTLAQYVFDYTRLKYLKARQLR